MTTRVYCTYFDHNYLSRGLALYYSMQRHAPGSRLWVLCLSEVCYNTLLALQLPQVVALRLQDFEMADPEVAATRPHRSAIEYYFTCTAAWMLFVMNSEKDAEWVTYLDGDLYFYNSPEPIFDELKNASVAIIPHRYTDKLRRMKKFGTYNVGWVGARNDLDGIAVVKWWRSQSIEWCHDYVDGRRFADQGYLDLFVEQSTRVKVIENSGANLAPWNIGNYRIAFHNEQVVIDSSNPLLFFHFQGLRKALRWFIFSSHRAYHAPFSLTIRNHIYRPYVQELLAIEENIGPLVDVSKAKPHGRSAVVDIHQYLRGKARSAGNLIFQLLDIATNRAFFVYRSRLR